MFIGLVGHTYRIRRLVPVERRPTAYSSPVGRLVTVVLPTTPARPACIAADRATPVEHTAATC